MPSSLNLTNRIHQAILADENIAQHQPATTSSLGLIKIGEGLTVDGSGTVSVTGAAPAGPAGRRVHTVALVSGSITIDWSLYDEVRLTLVGNVSLTFIGATDGQGCILKITQDGVGGRSVTLPASVRFSDDVSSFTPSSAALKADRIGFIYDSIDAKYDFVSMIKGF